MDLIDWLNGNAKLLTSLPGGTGIYITPNWSDWPNLSPSSLRSANCRNLRGTAVAIVCKTEDNDSLHYLSKLFPGGRFHCLTVWLKQPQNHENVSFSCMLSLSSSTAPGTININIMRQLESWYYCIAFLSSHNFWFFQYIGIKMRITAADTI